ncbi:MAG: MBL fold metallo-hydrolase [Oscillospiraceae bacterium]|nr:MBL fold metallo-hydrolase [Oscillospiraceae bacterium]
MILRFLGQSGYLLQSADTRILIDPYLSDSVNRVAGRPRMLPVPLTPEELFCDAVFCTHNHLDHLDPDTAVQFPETQKFFTTAEGCEVLKNLNRPNCTALKVGQPVTVGVFQVTPVFALHSTDAVGLIVQAEGYTLYFSGDTLYDERLFDIADFKPDICLICINGRLGNMDCDQALATAKAIGAPVNIPNHYDMFASNSADPHSFADRIPGGTILEFNRPYALTELITK